MNRLQDEATPQALKRKPVSPGDKSRPFGIEKELEVVWGESECGKVMRSGDAEGGKLRRHEGMRG